MNKPDTDGTEVTARGRHVPALDGVRGIAIGMVMVGHLWHGPPIPGFSQLAAAGPYGVDVFFALSGFLITGILLRSHGKARYYRNFYVRRFFRIIPLYFAYLALVFTPRLMVELFSDRTMPDVGSPVVYFTFVSNLYFALRGTFVDPLLDFSWSLCIEEQFYLLFPLLVASVPRRWLVGLLVVVALISGPVRWMVYDPDNYVLTYVFTPLRSDGLAMGALAAIALKQGQSGILAATRAATVPLTLAVIGLAGASFVGFGRGPTAVMHTLVPAWSTCLIVWAVTRPQTRLSRLLALQPLTYVGKVSYALYLLHPAAFLTTMTFFVAAGVQVEASLLYSFLVLVISFGLAVLMATLSWRTLEEPMLKLKDRFAPSSVSAVGPT